MKNRLTARNKRTGRQLSMSKMGLSACSGICFRSTFSQTVLGLLLTLNPNFLEMQIRALQYFK